MFRMNQLIVAAILVVFSVSDNYIFAQKQLSTKVCIVGAGTGGTAAALQSARSGIPTLLFSETLWLGGMLTAAGVSCTDGNHQLASGIWNEFRKLMYQHYGTKNLATGWVSNFNFEPHIGDSIFKSLAAKLPNLTILYGYTIKKVWVSNHGQVIQKIGLEDATGKTITVIATQFIDGTELGDLLAMAGAGFDVGLEPEQVSGEMGFGVQSGFGVIQDLTYAAVLKDYGIGADKTIPMPLGYQEEEFACSSNEDCTQKNKLYSNVNAQKMLDYGRLPHQKFMINWPANGNDFYTNIIDKSINGRQLALDSAKQKTLRFVYYIQTKLGKKHIGLADDEFPTKDLLPFIPYHREGRRVHGLVRFTTKDILRRGDSSWLFRTGISVGDYPIDHHHRMFPGKLPNLSFVPVPSYAIPAGALIAKDVQNLFVVEKGISVSNIMNGTTRLQPVVLLTGQSAGMMAALAVQKKCYPSQLNIRLIQSKLLEAGCYIQPLVDVLPSDPDWLSIQKATAAGAILPTGKAEGWANRTFFYPDSLVQINEWKQWMQSFDPQKQFYQSIGKEGVVLRGALKQFENPYAFKQSSIDSLPANHPLTRRLLARWLVEKLHCFEVPINWQGQSVSYKKENTLSLIK